MLCYIERFLAMYERESVDKRRIGYRGPDGYPASWMKDPGIPEQKAAEIVSFIILDNARFLFPNLEPLDRLGDHQALRE